MDFHNREVLLGHIKSILEFYEPNIVDSSGGFIQSFTDDGSLFDTGSRHLVSSCRMVFKYCKASDLFGGDSYREYAQHGLDYTRARHWDEARQGYNWTLQEGHVAEDQTNHCYGLAFVTLSAAAAHELGLEGARDDIIRAWNIMESRLWDSSIGLYADEATPDWSEVGSYRGQNANMYSCEALIAAFEATGDERFLERAYQLARHITVELADKSNGFIWEYFTSDLDIVLTADNQKYGEEKSTAGGKCDDHTIGACWDVLSVSDQIGNKV